MTNRMGRPSGVPTAIMSVKLPATIAELAKKRAAQRGMSLNEYLGLVIHSGVVRDHHGKGKA